MKPKLLITPTETADKLDVKVRALTVWRSTKRYPLHGRKIRRRVMYHISDIEALAENDRLGA